MSDAPETTLAAFLDALGFEGDPEMQNTPQRVTAFLREFVPQEGLPPVSPVPTRSHSPVVLRDLRFYSLCAHHLLPFFGTVTIGYVPRDTIAGLGWFPKVVDHLARRPQVQERLAEQLADAIVEALDPSGVVVHVEARHLCMEMRGSRATGTVEVTARRGTPPTL